MHATIIALYDQFGDAAGSIRHLEATGIAADDISVVASNLGDRYATLLKANSRVGAGGGYSLQATLEIRAIRGVGAVAARGWLLAAATDGGLIESLPT